MNRRTTLHFLMILLIGGLFAGCIAEEGAPVRAWIDFPLDGMSVAVGEPVGVISHAYARAGLAEALLMVNGEAYRRDPYPQPGVDFGEIGQEWHPDAPGTYTLQVIAYDVQGAASLPASVSVQVGGVQVEPPVENGEEENVPPTPTFTPSPSPTVTFTPVPPQVEQPAAPACPPAATALQSANCRSGPGTAYPVIGALGAGASATVTGRNADSSWWVIENPGAAGTCWVWSELVQLSTDTCDVPVQQAPPPPPTDTPTPTLTPTTPPPPPPDTAPPPVPAPQSPANGSVLGCISTVTLAWSPVDDPSGVVAYYVKLEKKISEGNWQSVGGYTATTNQVNVSVDCGPIYRWAVRAEDGAGNISDWSAFSQFGVNLE